MTKEQSDRKKKYDIILLGLLILGIICGVLDVIIYGFTIIPTWIVLLIYFTTGIVSTIFFKRFYEWVDGKAHILLHLIANLLIWSNIIMFLFLGSNQYIKNNYFDTIIVKTDNVKVLYGRKRGYKVKFDCVIDGINKTLRFNFEKEELEKYKQLEKSIKTAELKINKGLFGLKTIDVIEFKY